MSKINYDKFIKYLVEHSASDEFKNALYAQGLYFDNNELKSIEYRPKFKIGDRITDGRWIYTVKDMDLFNNLYSLENDIGYKTNMVFSYIDKEYKLANIGISTELTESEDEKIRKDLIEWFEEFPDKIWRGHYKKDVISWLEKQGESYTKRDVDDAWLKGMCDAKRELEKQGEQKPTQEIEPFEAEHGKYYYCIKDYFCGGRKQASKGDVVQALRGLPIMGLKDAGEYFLPVNSIKCNSAWSEEDEKMLVDAYVMLDWYKGNNWWTARRIKDWLKALKQRIGG